jgi:adenylate cyclase
MSAVTHPAAGVPGRALARLRSVRDELEYSRSLRLRLYLLTGAALIGALGPLVLAATSALHSVGVHASGSSPQNLVLVAILGIAAPLASLRLSALQILGVGATLAVLLTLLAAGNVDMGAMLSLAYPALALVVSVLGTLAANHVLLEFEHEHTRLQCSRFVPEQVADVVLSSKSDVALGGIEVSGTIMFVDLRGFTTFSESRPAGQVIRVLNHYLSEIQCAVLAHGGTTVSYLGDGLMAVFGAPIEQEDHADRALAAAREILTHRLPAANEWMQAQGLGEGFRLGIGVNSGSFIAGNVGSDRRLEYTAIGDTANTASRIQELTKHAKRMLLVDRSTCDCLCDDAPDLEPVGQFDVRGREGTVQLWSLTCGTDCPLGLPVVYV